MSPKRLIIILSQNYEKSFDCVESKTAQALSIHHKVLYFPLFDLQRIHKIFQDPLTFKQFADSLRSFFSPLTPIPPFSFIPFYTHPKIKVINQSILFLLLGLYSKFFSQIFRQRPILWTFTSTNPEMVNTAIRLVSPTLLIKDSPTKITISDLKSRPRVFLPPPAPSLIPTRSQDPAPLAWMEFIPRPIIGYLGRIDEFLDLNLVKNLALRFPNLSFVLAGPIFLYPRHQNLLKIADLKLLKNVFFVDTDNNPKHIGYIISQFKVGLLPFSTSKPLNHDLLSKIHIYLTHRKSVIGPRPHLGLFSPNLITQCGPLSSWIAAIKYHLTEKHAHTPTQRKFIASSSWSSRIDAINTVLDQLI